MTKLSHANAVVLAGGIASAAVGWGEPIIGLLTFATTLWYAHDHLKKGHTE